jgi:glyoxylase-like metal-dependent hydrolase (beta-lactamase superfamily II)
MILLNEGVPRPANNENGQPTVGRLQPPIHAQEKPAMPEIQHFFDPQTWTLSYVVHDGSHGVVIDPVRNYDPKSARTAWTSAQEVAAYIDARKLTISHAIDTHAHADHMTGLPFFRERYGARTVTGARIGEIQRTFRDIYNLGDDFPVDGRQFDLLLDEGQTLPVGSFEVEALHTPGHTPAHMSWKIADAVFVGDTLFMPDYGSARCDFPGGCAAQLYDSIQRLYALPDDTRLFMCHDYQPGGRPLAFQTTVGEQKRANVQINGRTTREEYVALRQAKDATLAAPVLILPSLQVNIRAGELPPPESNGTRYLKIPLDVLGKPAA